MKKNKKEKCWWSGLTADDMKSISKKKSQKKKTREPWQDDYSDYQYIYAQYSKKNKKI